MTPPLRLHGVRLSGHVHKVEMFLRLLELPYDYVEAPRAARQYEGFRKLNPLRQIPVLEEGDRAVADSNAILVYLAKRYDRAGTWLPEDAAGAAAVQRWLSISAGEIKQGLADCRAARLAGGEPPAAARQIGERVLGLLDSELRGRAWLAGVGPTLADVACYPYVACAPEGGFDISAYPGVSAWVARVERLPRALPMPRRPAEP